MRIDVLALLLTCELCATCFAEEELRKKVEEAWKTNLQKLGAVELEISRDKTPRKLTLFHDQYRYDDPRSAQKWAYDGSLWYEHDASLSQFYIRRAEHMPGMYPLDLREHFMHEVREPFLTVTPQATFGKPTEPDVQKYAVQMTATIGGQRFVTVFDEQQGLLPVESIMHHADGSLLRHTVIKYRYIKARDAYLAYETVTRYFPEGTATLSNYRTAQAVTTIETKVEKFTLVEDPQSGKLTLEYPVGTWVIDYSDD